MAHWKQVAGWRKICDLAQTHLSRLREYRRGLAEAWPPATNAAARAYLAELDELIDKVRRTHDAAAANYTALAAATQAISGTRARLKTIHEEYAAKLQQKQAYEATAADPKAAMGSRVPDRPVTDADLEQLNVQARGIMYGLSSELQQAQVTLRQPPPPPPRPGHQANDPDVYRVDGSPPVIPPVVPVPIPKEHSASSASPARSISRVQVPAGVGPVLGGASSGLASPPTKAGGAAVQNMAPSAEVSLPPSTPPSGNNLIPPHPASIAQSIGENGPVSTRQSSSLPRHTVSGGAIGGTNAPTPPTASSSSPNRVNPIGGVIGGGGSAGTAPAGGAGSRPGASRTGQGTTPIGGAPWQLASSATGQGPRGTNDRLGRQDHKANESGWNPDNPWETNKGVPPVVLPPDEQGPIDPGPAIGLNR
ncbi:hypothetical protein [Micromonospora globbae]|uniref:hypothetical protein n=1 Tax=Micromonospora globbae TaxID=1894969 RepID=UPI00387083A2|nr:hypothetical protein OH732_05925 [Micromonospora globbae]